MQSMPQQKTQPMKLYQYEPADIARDILGSWAFDPIIISDDSTESAKDAAFQSTFLALIVSAYRILVNAEDFCVEGNQAEISEVKKTLENIISSYSNTL
jgi:hypothetical protein